MTQYNTSCPVRVAIQGVAGCFHHSAARDYFTTKGINCVEPVECDTFVEMFDRLASDPELMAVMAMDNTIAGSILPNHELLRKSKVCVVGEYKMRISQMLCALPGQSVDDICEVRSHPMALMQCEQFLHRHPHMRLVETYDTAGSARDIAAARQRGVAAVCGQLAADLYGLKVLSRGIETNKHNFTRFLVLASPDMAAAMAPAESNINKSSIVFTLPDIKGALGKVLSIIAEHDINLTKIQSLPIIGREWEYRFYADLTFNVLAQYHKALEDIRPLIKDLRMLGEYPASRGHSFH